LTFVVSRSWMILGLSAALAVTVSAQDTPAQTFDQRLGEIRTELHVDGGGLSGPGSVVLKDAISKADFVLIGEDHLTKEIPRLTTAVCNAMGPDLGGMVLEIGPSAAEFVSANMRAADHNSRMTALLHKYPNSVAFADSRQENDLVSHCAAVSKSKDFHVWGLDQEFLGASGWLLEQMLATHPGPKSAAAIKRLQAEEQKSAAAAKASGDPSKLFLLSASEAELRNAKVAVDADGTPKAKQLFASLVESHEIYQKNAEGSPDANGQRARLMKRLLHADLAQTPQKKLLLKFGDWHLYKGVNPLHQRDIGNFVAERAESEGKIALHIIVLGPKGTRRGFAGYDKPTTTEPFVLTDDRDYVWMKPLIATQNPGSWTVFDLRKLRFSKSKPTDSDIERLIYGYDLMVLAPEITPADMLE
jgi:hypothetical protein